MLKKTLLAALLLAAMTSFSVAEETNTPVMEQEAPVSQCDAQHEACVEKCGDPAAEGCEEQCREAADKCDEAGSEAGEASQEEAGA